MTNDLPCPNKCKTEAVLVGFELGELEPGCVKQSKPLPENR